MKSLKEIFSREPEQMSRLVRRFFTLPLTYVLYLVVSLIIPRNLGLVSNLATYLVLLLSFFICMKTIAGAPLISIIQPSEKFRLRDFLCGFSIMGLSGIIICVVLGLTGIYSYSFTFDSSSFVFDWTVSLFLVFVASFVEELIFRGFIMHFVTDSVITENKNKLIYAVVSGILFTVNHFQNPETHGSTAVWAMCFYFVMGFSLMLIAISMNGIEATWGIHFANNLITAWIFGYSGSVISTNCLFTQMNPIGPAVVIQGSVCMLVCIIAFRRIK